MKKSKTKPFAVIDCETTSFKYGRVPKPYVWGYYNGTEYRQFFNTADFAAFLMPRHEIVFAHNGGRFDFHFLLEYLEREKEMLVIDGRLGRAYMGNCELRDSYMILPVPLRAYKKDDFDYSKLEDECWKLYIDELSEYLKNDCIYLWQIIERQRAEYGGDLTLASSAMNFWANRFHPEGKPKSNRAFFDMMRPFYYGGRVECFEKGHIEKPFKVFDINSAYPFAMCHPHPWGDCPRAGDKVPAEPSLSFIECTGVSNGAFPHRGRDGSLTFPADNETRTFHVTGHEWQAALDLGLFKGTVDRVLTFEQSISFTPYVNHFYELKAASKGTDAAAYLLAKLYMNSLYGKFGQNSAEHHEYVLTDPATLAQKVDAGWNFCGECGPHAMVCKPTDESKQRYFNLATAASITGFVRAYLLRHIKASTGVLYVDTDSIACADFKGTLGAELGQWAHEGDFSEAAIGGKKLYAFRKAGKTGWQKECFKTATKGSKLSPHEIFSVAKGEIVVYKNSAPTFSLNRSTSFVKREIKLT